MYPLKCQSHHFHSFAYSSLYDLKERSHMELYFKFKHKHEHAFSPEEASQFQAHVLESLGTSDSWQDAHAIVVPQTTNQNLLNLARASGKALIVLQKNTLGDILAALEHQAMMKGEREKLYRTLEGMTTIAMAGIAGNQRSRLVQCLFKPLNRVSLGPCVMLDDSIFSGATFLAAQHALSGIAHTNVVLFDKSDTITRQAHPTHQSVA